MLLGFKKAEKLQQDIKELRTSFTYPTSLEENYTVYLDHVQLATYNRPEENKFWFWFILSPKSSALTLEIDGREEKCNHVRHYTTHPFSRPDYFTEDPGDLVCHEIC